MQQSNEPNTTQFQHSSVHCTNPWLLRTIQNILRTLCTKHFRGLLKTEIKSEQLQRGKETNKELFFPLKLALVLGRRLQVQGGIYRGTTVGEPGYMVPCCTNAVVCPLLFTVLRHG